MTPTINKGLASASANLGVADVKFTKVGEFTFVTPEMLMAFCSAKLRGLDEQIQRSFQKQNGRNAASAAMSELANAIGNHAKGKGILAGGEAAKKEIYAAYDKAIKAAGPDTEIGLALQKEYDRFKNTATGTDPNVNDPAIDLNEMKTYVEGAQKVQSDSNRAGELEMIQLQSLTSMRQQAVQLCTNLISTLNQTNMAVIQNCK